MATLVWTDAFVLINAIEETDHTRSVTLNYEAEIVDETAMAQTTRINKPGLFTWSLEWEFYHDTADADIDERLFALVGAAAFGIEVRPNASGGVTSTNPSFIGNVVLQNFPVISGAVGDMAVSTCTFMSAGALARAET